MRPILLRFGLLQTPTLPRPLCLSPVSDRATTCHVTAHTWWTRICPPHDLHRWTIRRQRISSAPAALWERRSPTGGSTAACLGVSTRGRPASSSHSSVARACQRARGMLSSCTSSAGRSGAAGRSAGEVAPAYLRCCLRRLQRQQPPPCASTRSYQRPARAPGHQARPARARRGLHGIARTLRTERLHPPKAQAAQTRR